MEGLTVHIATEGYVAPGDHSGSNPLIQGSDFHLGPELTIFNLFFTPEVGYVDFDQHFVVSTNSFITSVPSDQLSVVMAASGEDAGPIDLRVRISGVSYKVLHQNAARIRGKNGSRVHWVATKGLGFVEDQGSFKFHRNASSV
jgi:hypothetical protein